MATQFFPQRDRPASDANLPAETDKLVNEVQNGSTDRARALMAQPFASGAGPRLRFFNLNHATIVPPAKSVADSNDYRQRYLPRI